MFNGLEFRFICTKNKSALENMSIDKSLVKNFKVDDKPIFRLYTWEKSFTVGISQKTDDYVDKYPTYNKNCAKRITGGGILFHGHDVSYSLVIPTKLSSKINVKETYEKICQFLLTFYKDLNLDANFAKDCENITLSKSDFCQIGFEAYDIIIKNKKIGGNAQKWTKNVIFQHGSVPIEKLDSLDESGYSLIDVDTNITKDFAIDGLKKAFEKTYNAKLIDSKLTNEENEYLEKLLKESNDC